ncbi:MAG: N-acetylmuramoyl-L-alanine amidase [Terrimicrobiaceae bacterium]
MRNPKLAFWMLLLGGSLLLVSTLRAQMSDEEKRRLFLQSREDIHPVSKPSPSVTPRQKPQPASTPRPKPKSTPVAEETEEPTATPRPTPKSTPVREEKAEPVTRSTPKSTPDPAESEEPAATPHPRPKTTPPSEDREEPKSTPRPTPKPMHPPVGKEDPDPTPHSKKTTPEPAPEKKPEPPKSSETPDFIDVPDQPVAVKKAEKASPTPESSPVGQPVPAISPAQIPQGKTPQGQALDAPILVEKSGLDEDQGIEAPPKPQFGGFFKRYRYLTPSVRKAIDQARVQRGRWKYIIVHNSGTRQGNARIFDVYHRRVRKMQNGMAYHFVIGNGNSSGNGEIEIGNRWIRQINGGHVASDYLNNISLGICLVGDLNRDKPTKDQLAALDELITYLRGRVGKIKGKQAIVKGHKEINPKPTDCPGDRFPLSWLRQRFR